MKQDANINIPLDVPYEAHEEFILNYKAITFGTNRTFIFSCDQKIEHLNNDFYGNLIDRSANDPEHLFKIADQGRIGALATQLGLINRYGQNYPNINYIVKLNSKTNIVPTEIKDPLSELLWDIDDVIKVKNNTKLKIRGIGYTIYLGSEYEHIMLSQAAKLISKAHQAGLVTILWIYPRSKYIEDEKDGKLIAGAAGVANCLGSDFVKVQVPRETLTESIYQQLKIASQACGNTKLICAGGELKNINDFLTNIFDQINIGNTSGAAIGRNIFQRSQNEAIRLTKAISDIVYDLKDLNTVLKEFK